MAQIAIEGMRFYAYHGFYEEEQVIGGDYIIDVYIQTDITLAALSDELEATINYETVYVTCRLEMQKKVKLLETIVHRILEKLKFQYQNMLGARIRIRKMNPVLGGPVKNTYVEEAVSFVKPCSRCGNPFICYEDDNCWCKDVRFFPKTKEGISRSYKGCICKNCQMEFAG